jgi:hypothetical protein
MGKNQNLRYEIPDLRSGIRDPEYWINISDRISVSLIKIFWVKNNKVLRQFCVADPGWKNPDPGFGISIPDS